MSARNTVSFKLDGKRKQMAGQRKRLAAVAAMPDSKIDYSDIPESSSALRWTRPGDLVPSENKQQITLRLDADVLSFFKETGNRYQSRINAALREYMKAHQSILEIAAPIAYWARAANASSPRDHVQNKCRSSGALAVNVVEISLC